MRALLPAILLPMLALQSACAPKVNDPADVQAVKQTMEAYTKAITAKDAPAHHDILSQVTPEDLVEYGFLPEVAGRIREVIVMRSLTKDDLRCIPIDNTTYIVKYKWSYSKYG